ASRSEGSRTIANRRVRTNYHPKNTVGDLDKRWCGEQEPLVAPPPCTRLHCKEGVWIERKSKAVGKF
ncbi:hypothetical protein A2U01_0115139, partial [Trifolium medium]|nr:hypothetical protein [Trifolium medium]